MGGGKFDTDAYAAFSNSTVGKSTDEIYTSRTIDNRLNPFGVNMRESRDSADNPNSTPLIVALDVTGSMGFIADNIAREGLGTLFQGIFDRKPITDPHVMFMGVGDANYDRAPLQVSQFEADMRIVEQLTQLYLEHGGGGNNYESYNLPWFFAARHTVHDAMEVRGRKGYLFTVGDEETPADLTEHQIKEICGDSQVGNLNTHRLLEEANRTYHVFHVSIMEGSHARTYGARVREAWTHLLGQRAIFLADYKRLAETIVSAIEVTEGAEAKKSADMWDNGAGRVVYDAVKNLPRGSGAPKMLGAP